MRMTDNLLRVGVYPKKDEFFRIQGRKDGQLFYVTSEKFVIGSAPDADVVITGANIAGHHLYVMVKDRELWLENVAPLNHTLVSGQALTSQEPFHYKPNEVIQVGQASLLITVELFSRYLDPKLEAEIIVREANEKAQHTEQQIRLLKKEMKTTVEQAQRESAVIESKTRVEIETLLATAHRQIEEKNRQSIEESHQRAEALQQQAKLQSAAITKEGEGEAKKIIERAQAAAAELVNSAKNEVDVLLKQGRGQAIVMGHEAEERKKEAIQFVRDLQGEISKLIEDKERFEAETHLSKQLCDEAIQKKQTFLQQTRDTENEYLRVRGRLDEFKETTKKVEEEHRQNLQNLNVKCAEAQAQTKQSQELRKQEENTTSGLKAVAKDLQAQVDVLTLRQTQFELEAEEALKTKKKIADDIAALTKSYQSELSQLREKIDEEYRRQMQVHEVHFQKLRDQECVLAAHRQKRIERLEAKYLRRQIQQTQERLGQVLADRAALYGVAHLKDNLEFKADVISVISNTLTEEFTSRRQEVFSVKPGLRASIHGGLKNKMKINLRLYGGWALFAVTLIFLIYRQRATPVPAIVNSPRVIPAAPSGQSGDRLPAATVPSSPTAMQPSAFSSH